MVAACSRQLYEVTVTLTLLAEPDSEIVIVAAEAGLQDLALRADRLGGSLTKELIAGAAVTLAAVNAATVTLETIDTDGNATPADGIESVDGVALQLRVVTVGVT